MRSISALDGTFHAPGSSLMLVRDGGTTGLRRQYRARRSQTAGSTEWHSLAVISVVMPAHNEAGNISAIAAAIAQAMALSGNYEIVFKIAEGGMGRSVPRRQESTPRTGLRQPQDRDRCGRD